MGAPESFDRRETIHRIGTFFLIMGIGLLVLFLLSESSGSTTFEYFCASLLLLTLGFLFRAQYKKARPSSGRFSVFQRFRKGKDE